MYAWHSDWELSTPKSLNLDSPPGEHDSDCWQTVNIYILQNHSKTQWSLQNRLIVEKQQILLSGKEFNFHVVAFYIIALILCWIFEVVTTGNQQNAM